MNTVSIVERAFQIARSGEADKLLDLENRLRREGYENPNMRLQGRSLRAQLTNLMREARRTLPGRT